MTYTDKHIVNAYAELFEGLSSMNKLELIERLSKSIRSDQEKKEKSFFKSFGAFASDKSAEEIINDIKSSRNFRSKEIRL